MHHAVTRGKCTRSMPHITQQQNSYHSRATHCVPRVAKANCFITITITVTSQIAITITSQITISSCPRYQATKVRDAANCPLFLRYTPGGNAAVWRPGSHQYPAALLQLLCCHARFSELII